MIGIQVFKHVHGSFVSVALSTGARQVIPGVVSSFVLRNNVIDCGVPVAQLAITVCTFPVPLFKYAFTETFTSNLWTENNEVSE